MQAMQALIRLPEIAHTMQELSKEMMRAGIIEEMLDDTMSSMEDEEEVEEAAQAELDKVFTILSWSVIYFRHKPQLFKVSQSCATCIV